MQIRINIYIYVQIQMQIHIQIQIQDREKRSWYRPRQMKNWGGLAPEWLSMLSDYCLVVHLSTLQLPEQEFRSEHAVYHLKETFCNHFEVHCHVRRCRQRLRRGLDERNLSEFWLAPLTSSTWSVFLNDEHATITNNAKGTTEPSIAECEIAK